MEHAHDYFPECPEAFLVSLAKGGDRNAFAELVRRRQSWIRNLMRRCSGDATLADDLAQQVLIKVWTSIGGLKQPAAFGAWLRRLAVSVWLQHVRKNDALRGADELLDVDSSSQDSTGVGMDLDRALATLSSPVRLCIVLSYHEGMSHSEIAELTDTSLGTVKSHINRGTERLQKLLSAYRGDGVAEKSS